MPAGRPSDYSAEVTSKILNRLAEGESLASICRIDEMPSYQTVYEWKQRHPEFAEKYAEARNVGLDHLADKLIDIADFENEADTLRARLRVDTRKWYLSKLAPKRYGDRLEHVGAEGKDLIPAVDPTELAKRVAFLITSGAQDGQEET